jgi:hypothetical protein
MLVSRVVGTVKWPVAAEALESGTISNCNATIACMVVGVTGSTSDCVATGVSVAFTARNIDCRSGWGIG